MANYDHDHEYVDPTEFVFDDVLVTVVLGCSGSTKEHGPSCPATQSIQYEVQFNNLEDLDAGETVSESEAEEVWDAIGEKYGTTASLSYEKPKPASNSTLYRDRDSNEFEVFYDDDRRVDYLELSVNGTNYRLNVEHYRDLSPDV